MRCLHFTRRLKVIICPIPVNVDFGISQIKTAVLNLSLTNFYNASAIIDVVFSYESRLVLFQRN